MATTTRTGRRDAFGCCPQECTFRPDNGGGCYGTYYPLRVWVDRTAENYHKQRLTDPEELKRFMKTLPANWNIRHHQFGDLVEEGGGKVDKPYLKALRAARPSKGHSFTYTHSRDYLRNHRPGRPGETVINISTESDADAVRALKKGHPVVIVMPEGKDERPKKLSDGTPVCWCPAERYDRVTCSTCGGRPGVPLCAIPDRKFVVGFTPHGPGSKRVGGAVEGAFEV